MSAKATGKTYSKGKSLIELTELFLDEETAVGLVAEQGAYLLPR